MKRSGLKVAVGLAAILIGFSGSAPGAQRESLLRELRDLVDEENEVFLLTEIQRVQPYYAVRNLARFEKMQDRVGGGFCDCLPDQVINAREIPLPVDDVGVLETAIFLARHRLGVMAALAELGFPMAFPSFPFEEVSSPERFPSLSVTIDTSVPVAFLDALDDAEVTIAEAREIAQLPANREMLRFVCDRCAGAEPTVTEQTLSYLIWKAGSSDPLDRLWRWMNPTNDFGYAGLAAEESRFRGLIADLQLHHRELADAAVARVAPFLPYGATLSVRFAFTPGCPDGEWSTPVMSGTSVLRIKAGWDGVVQRISAAVFRQYLAEQRAGRRGLPREMSADAVNAGSADRGVAVLDEVIATTVLEGSVDFVSNPSEGNEEVSRGWEGAELINGLVEEIVTEADVESCRSLLERESGAHASLIALGRHMAAMVAERDGPQAVTALLGEGHAAFLLRASEIGSESGEMLFDRDTIFLVGDLADGLER